MLSALSSLRPDQLRRISRSSALASLRMVVVLMCCRDCTEITVPPLLRRRIPLILTPVAYAPTTGEGSTRRPRISRAVALDIGGGVVAGLDRPPYRTLARAPGELLWHGVSGVNPTPVRLPDGAAQDRNGSDRDLLPGDLAPFRALGRSATKR